MLYAENHIRKQHVCQLYTWEIKEHSGAKMEPNFFSQKILEKRSCERHLPFRLAKYETPIKQGALVPGGFEGHKERQAVYFTLVNSMDQKYKAYTHLKSHHDAVYALDVEGPQKEKFESYQTLNRCVITLIRTKTVQQSEVSPA